MDKLQIMPVTMVDANRSSIDARGKIPISQWFPLENLTKFFLKHELHLNLTSNKANFCVMNLIHILIQCNAVNQLT